mmetsp:Transcript_65155/g.167740  ORF Transcript_65155/g.167740 Transcript_65155/m.167740 type:complete len:487 (+) Transcript_65155:52-1512(+)
MPFDPHDAPSLPTLLQAMPPQQKPDSPGTSRVTLCLPDTGTSCSPMSSLSSALACKPSVSGSSTRTSTKDRLGVVSMTSLPGLEGDFEFERDEPVDRPMSMHLVGPDGTIQWASRDELKTLGYKAHEYIGKRIQDFHVSQSAIEDIFRRLMAGETLKDYEARMWHKDGSIVHVSINSSTYFDNEDNFVHTRCFTSNVTAKKLAELEEKERLTSELNQRLELLNMRLQREGEMNLTLLHQMMPAKVASDLTAGRKVPPEAFDHVTIFFSDIEGFTKIAAAVQTSDLMHMLNGLYTVMDHCAAALPVYKVETIGDAYMVVGGLPERSESHASAVADFALLVREAVKFVLNPLQPDLAVQLRMGMHSGPVMAGVVGNLMPRYCLFGDTVNTASRMESTGEAGRIHCSPQVMAELQRCGGYVTECRGQVEVKGKGTMTTNWLNHRAPGSANTCCSPACMDKMRNEIRELFAHTPVTTNDHKLNCDWELVD